MEMKAIIFIVSVSIATVTSQIQNVRVPPGALVEFEFEFINPKPGQPGGTAAGGGGAGGMPQMMAPAGRMMSPMMGGASQMMGGANQMMGGASQSMTAASPAMGRAAQMMGGATQAMGGAAQSMGGAGQTMGGGGQMMPPMPARPPGSPLQQLLTNMVKMALALRRMYGVHQPVPPMEEPCPCGADCCLGPREPRRILPVLSIPMTSHRGCCGCVDCPASLSPVISGMIQVAKMAASQQPPRDL